jgi:hypothetical protein
MDRPDLSNKLIHLTKGDSDEAALGTLLDIISDKALLGGTGCIRGGHRCVCFCETPISHLALVLANRNAAGFRYRPFGVMFSKQFIYEKKGRPVIYGEDDQYNELPPPLKYRHVLYDLTQRPPKDFTWEREWRVNTDKLEFSPEDVTVVFPNRQFIQVAHHTHSKLIEQRLKAGATKPIPLFKWHFVALEDLGIQIPVEKIEGISS